MDQLIKNTPNLFFFGITSFLGYSFQNEIKELIKFNFQFLIDQVFARLFIKNRSGSQVIFALKQELMQRGKIPQDVTDGGSTPNYKIRSGFYVLWHFGTPLIISFPESAEEDVVLWTFCNSVFFLQNFLNGICQKHLHPDNVIFFYFPNEKMEWSFPVPRRPIANIRITPKIQEFMNDFGEFEKPETESIYKGEGYPYRRGYLLSGPPQSGKTTCINLASQKSGRSVYVIGLVSQEIDDNKLVKLCATVPPRTIIVLEEFEKALETLQRASNKFVSEAGILSAIDGPQRLPHGVVVILTANNINDISKNFLEQLTRKGRIDKTIMF